MTKILIQINSIFAAFSKNVATSSLDVNQKNLVNAYISVNRNTMEVDIATLGQHTHGGKMGHIYVFHVFSGELPLGEPSVHSALNITYLTLGLYDLTDQIKSGNFKFGEQINDHSLFIFEDLN